MNGNSHGFKEFPRRGRYRGSNRQHAVRVLEGDIPREYKIWIICQEKMIYHYPGQIATFTFSPSIPFGTNQEVYDCPDCKKILGS